MPDIDIVTTAIVYSQFWWQIIHITIVLPSTLESLQQIYQQQCTSGIRFIL